MATFKVRFAPAFESAVHGHVQAFLDMAQDPFLGQMAEHIRPLVAGGKRLRPYLAHLGYAAGQGQSPAVGMELGIGLELFHVFCLIHDDIIDKATTRRGVPTVEAFVVQALAHQGRRGDGSHLARSQAILLGDLMFSWANRHVSAAALQSLSAETVMTEFCTMIDEVVVGQMIDVDTMTRDEHEEALLERKMALKTAGYSFVRPLRLGLQLSGQATPELLASMTAIGTPLGLAFQLQDDLLDITSTAEVLGKSTLSDIRDGQQTFLTAFVAREGQPHEQQLLKQVMTGQGTEADALALREVFLTGQAVPHTQARIDALWAEARLAIAAAPFTDSVRQDFLNVIATLEHRAH